jgi:hypothetical protein
MIKMRLMLMLFSALWLSSCGGGGGGSKTPAAKSAVLKLACNGALAANLEGLRVTVSLPPGVTAAVDATGVPLPTVVTASGVTTNNTAIPTILMNYTAPTASAGGSLSFVLANTAGGGFGAGEFATVTLAVATGSNPTAGDFVASDFDPIDVIGNHVPGLTATVTATIQ